MPILFSSLYVLFALYLLSLSVCQSVCRSVSDNLQLNDSLLLSCPNSRDAIASKKCGNNQPLIGLIYWRQIADLDRKLTLNYLWKGHINKSYQVCWPCVRWMNQILKYYVFTYFTINSLNGRQNEIIKNVEVAGFRLNNTY